jgi:hypothetical protein
MTTGGRIQPTGPARVRLRDGHTAATSLTVLDVDRVEPLDHQVVLLCRHPATLTVAVADVAEIAELSRRGGQPTRVVYTAPADPPPSS